VACAVMQCSRPDCDRWQRIEGECCSVKCIQVSNKNSTHIASLNGFTGTYCVLCCSVLILVFSSVLSLTERQRSRALQRHNIVLILIRAVELMH